MTNLCQGRLVWIDVTGLDGRPKRRPVVITTPDTDIASATELAGIACSHSAVLRSPRPADYFDMPYHPSGRCRSKLTKPTIAICRWTVKLPKADIETLPDRYIGGVVPRTLVQQLIQASERWIREDGDR